MRLILLIMVALFAVTDAEASIVNDPDALQAKLDQMMHERLDKQAKKEAYWADYRKNHEEYTVTRCGKRITSQGVVNYCRPHKQYRYTGTMEYPR